MSVLIKEEDIAFGKIRWFVTKVSVTFIFRYCLSLEFHTCSHCGCSVVNTFMISNQMNDGIIAYMREHPYLQISDCCWKCLCMQEIGFVGTLSAEKLPLYINHEWITYRGEEAYKRRIRGDYREYVYEIFIQFNVVYLCLCSHR